MHQVYRAKCATSLLRVKDFPGFSKPFKRNGFSEENTYLAYCWRCCDKLGGRLVYLQKSIVPFMHQ